MRSRDRGFCRRYALLVVLVVGLGSLPGSTHARGIEACVTAEVASPMLLPDGSLHRAGSIRICLDRELTPTTGLHRTYVDGMPVGVFMSEVGKSEDRLADAAPVMHFFHSRSGAWVLAGYTLPDGEGMITYGLSSGGAERIEREPSAPSPGETAILVAAR